MEQRYRYVSGSNPGVTQILKEFKAEPIAINACYLKIHENKTPLVNDLVTYMILSWGFKLSSFSFCENRYFI